jgi:hypothetical protein
MSHSIELLQRAVKTIESCKTLEQLQCADRYSDLVCKKYSKCVKKNDIWYSLEQAFKAIDLKLELNQLLRHQQSIIENKC